MIQKPALQAIVELLRVLLKHATDEKNRTKTHRKERDLEMLR